MKERSDSITLGTCHFRHFRHFFGYTGEVLLFDGMSKNPGVKNKRTKWCDLRCNWADSAKLEALDGSCRTFQSLWCDKLKQHVTKNAPCEVLFGKRRPG